MEIKQMKVKDVMTRDPLTIDPEAPLRTAIDLMRARKIRHLPAVDTAGRLVGIITDRDLRQGMFAPVLAEHLSFAAQRRFQSLARAFEDLRVRDAMTWGVITTDPEVTIAHAAMLMFERRVGSLPVVEGGKLVGILSERDLLNALRVELPAPASEVEAFLW